MNKIFKVIIIACILIFILSVSGSLIYYYAYFKPHNEEAKWKEELEWEKEKQLKEELVEKEKEQEEKFQELLREKQLNDCLNKAYENYIDAWDKQVERLGSKDGFLPGITADKLNESYEKAKEECFRLYGSD